MSSTTDNAREIALRARAEAAVADADAARAVVRRLEWEARSERRRARMLSDQLEKIARLATRAASLTHDSDARDVLGMLALNAQPERFPSIGKQLGKCPG